MQAEVPGGVQLLKLLQVTPDGTIPENIAKVNIIILQHVTSVVEALCWFFFSFNSSVVEFFLPFSVVNRSFSFSLFCFFFLRLQELAKLKEENRTLYEELMELRRKIKVRTS